MKLRFECEKCGTVFEPGNHIPASFPGFDNIHCPLCRTGKLYQVDDDGAVVRRHNADPYQAKLAEYWKDFLSWDGGGRSAPHDDKAERYAEAMGAKEYRTVAFMAMVAGREWKEEEKKLGTAENS